MVKEPSNNGRGAPGEPTDHQDRRKHARVERPLKARFLNEAGQERPCVVVNVSAGGAYVQAKNPPAFGEKVVLYIEGLGRFEAQVIRSDRNSFAVSYQIKRAKRARTADDLTEIINRGHRSPNRRVSPRIRQDAPTVVHFEDGSSVKCALLDISLTGASIEISPRPPLGAHLILGRMTAKVVRRHEKGVGVVFTGSVERMDDVVKEASSTIQPSQHGAGIAPTFGKKGAG